MGDVQFDDESGEGDTMVVERERDLALSAQARQTIADIDAALERMADGTYGYSRRVRPADPARAPRGDPVGDGARRGEGRRDRPPLMTPIRVDERSSARSPARAAGRSPPSWSLVDQLTKQWALERARRRHTIDVVWTLRFNLAFNTGMAFSQGDRARARSSASSPCSSSSACWCRSAGRPAGCYPLAVGLIIGGAVGNLARPAVPRRRAGSAAASSTSSTCSGGRSSTSPTSPSRSAARCSLLTQPAPPAVGTDGRADEAADAGRRVGADGDDGAGADDRRAGPGRARRRAARPGRRAARRRQPVGGGGGRSTPAACASTARSPTSGKVRLDEGAVVEVDPAAIPRPAPPGADPDVEFDVVHVDDDVIVVDKPAGLVVHPGAGNPDGTLVNGLLARFPELAGVGEPIAPGHRPPPRRRQLRAARRRPHRRRGARR